MKCSRAILALMIAAALLSAVGAEAARSLPSSAPLSEPPRSSAAELSSPAADTAGSVPGRHEAKHFSFLTASSTLPTMYASLRTMRTGDFHGTTADRFRLDLLQRPSRLPSAVVTSWKLASGGFDKLGEANIWETGRIRGRTYRPTFQGLWTDPVTGLAYARNRWYDARTASWLSEDSYGSIDSENLYAFVGWQPHMYSDPTGEYIESGWDIASLTMGGVSLNYNIKHGNWGSAAWDVFGIAVDTAAVLLPGVPGGAGAATKAVRAAQKIDQLGNVVQAGYAARESFAQGGVSGYGWGAFNVGMGLLGARQVAANPWKVRINQQDALTGLPVPQLRYLGEANDPTIRAMSVRSAGRIGATEGPSSFPANRIAGNNARDAIAAREALANPGATVNIEQSFFLGSQRLERRLDVVVSNRRTIGYESKVGRTHLNRRTRQELARDVRLLRRGDLDEIIWEFSRSDVTGMSGPTIGLMNRLRQFEKYGIRVVIR